MLKSAQIHDFQSIDQLWLNFDKFTVLVGPSNSGKSAALRAIRAVIRNTFVPSNVRQGQLKSMLRVAINDFDIVAHRGKSLSTYHMENKSYPKSGKSVPEPIVKVLKMPLVEGIDPHFSFQFDRPFLLAESGATAASVIGSLTNVSVLHAAVREANRRRGGVSSTLKVRQLDKERLQKQVETFRFLPARKKSIDRAKSALQSAEELRADLDALRLATDALEASQAFLATFTLPEVPDIDLSAVESALEEMRLFNEIVEGIEEGLTSMKRYARLESGLNETLNTLDQEYEDILKEAGVCPTCGRAFHE